MSTPTDEHYNNDLHDVKMELSCLNERIDALSLNFSAVERDLEEAKNDLGGSVTSLHRKFHGMAELSFRVSRMQDRLDKLQAQVESPKVNECPPEPPPPLPGPYCQYCNTRTDPGHEAMRPIRTLYGEFVHASIYHCVNVLQDQVRALSEYDVNSNS